MTTEPEAIPAETPLNELVDRALEKMATGGWHLTLTHPDPAQGSAMFGFDVPKAIADRASRAPVDGAEAKPVAWPEPKVVNPDIANPTGVAYIDSLLHQMLDAQQDINLAANTYMDQSLCDASALLDETETVIRKLTIYPAPASPDAEMVKRETFQSCGEWADATFGPATVLRRLERAEEELEEAKTAEPNKVMEEIADVVICLAAAAHSFGGDLQVAIDAKMAINRKREWNVRGDGTGYHVSSSDAVAPPLSKHGVDR